MGKQGPRSWDVAIVLRNSIKSIENTYKWRLNKWKH
jgi:hypothetical protein